MVGSTELPGLMGVVDRLLLAATCREEDKCREYVRTCVVGTVLSIALMRLALSKKKISVEKLYEAVASQIEHDLVLQGCKDFVAEMLDKTMKYLEARGDIKNGAVTRDVLLKMIAHVDTAMIFLGCWSA